VHKKDYAHLEQLLTSQHGELTRSKERNAQQSLKVAFAGYDLAIHEYFNPGKPVGPSKPSNTSIRENPHQQAYFVGDWGKIFKQLNGKEISYNNRYIDAAIQLIANLRRRLFSLSLNTRMFVVLLPEYPWRLGSCTRGPESAFGGVLAAKNEIDISTAMLLTNYFLKYYVLSWH
jgi:phosphoribosylaminoimidazolecarboxamide formyltransferase/IMP cyclohydrolase